MRKITLYALVILLLSHTMSQVIIVSNFLYNQDYIAQNLCENKEKPVLKCNGKCQLAKELEQNEEKPSNQTIPETEISLFIALNEKIEIKDTPLFSTIRSFPISREEGLLMGIQSSVFHPPC